MDTNVVWVLVRYQNLGHVSLIDDCGPTTDIDIEGVRIVHIFHSQNDARRAKKRYQREEEAENFFGSLCTYHVLKFKVK